jgi:hypothetical protein
MNHGAFALSPAPQDAGQSSVGAADAEIDRFRHNSVEDLDKRLGRLPADALKLVVLEGVYSMLGDVAPLPEMVAGLSCALGLLHALYGSVPVPQPVARAPCPDSPPGMWRRVLVFKV